MDLTPQEPADGIMKMGTRGFYRVACDCGCEGHDLVVDVETDDDMTVVEIFANVKTQWWRERFHIDYDDPDWVNALKRFANGTYNRVTLAFTALFKGYIETETSIILKEQQVTNFAEVLLKSSRESRATSEPSGSGNQDTSA